MYSSKLLTIPVPRYYVFYNGLKKAADEVILKLTDSMAGTNASKVSSAEFTAHMININAGHSAQIMERCPLLHQYSLFVAALRKKISDGLSLWLLCVKILRRVCRLMMLLSQQLRIV